MIKFLAAAALAAMAGVAAAAPQSPYAGQEAREIKALSADRVAGLKAGAGLGYALSAELNGYPGPAHLLELADDIPLTPEQLVEITAIRDAMQADAIALGHELLDAEAAIEAAFRAGGLSETGLSALTQEAAAIDGRLRARHLAAHLAAAKLLSPHQIHMYQKLRGYGDGHAGHHHHHK